MSAFIPDRRAPDVTEQALARVCEDKEREAGDGFDGTSVAHPDLVPVAMEVFDRALGDRPNQKERMREDVDAAINDLMQDTATAEISRSRLWQWCTHGVTLDDGTPMTRERYEAVREEELAALRDDTSGRGHLEQAASILDALVLADDFPEFLTLVAYGQLD